METTLQIHDVQEKKVGEVQAPSFPTISRSSAGFPEHKKRTKASAFKQRRQAEQATQTGEGDDAASSVSSRPGWSADETRKIDQENKRRLNKMSADEIEAAQREIFESMDPALLQGLLRRANLDDAGPAPLEPRVTEQIPSSGAATIEGKDKKERGGNFKKSESSAQDQPKKRVTFDEDAAPPAPPADLLTPSAANTTHFPKQSVPDLDPNDPNFLENLHNKFFPNLPADPSKLAWMAPLPTPNSTADRESPYHPAQDSLPVSALRFDFQGKLIPPRLSRQIPTDRGLHHHGEAPEAAGYTIPELARLARSAVPGQRCIAFQTLGRMLFRLGDGEWGIGEGGRAGEEDDLAFGLWRCFLEKRVLDTLNEAAAVEDGAGHMASKAYAVEALWLFEKGGWKVKWRGM